VYQLSFGQRGADAPASHAQNGILAVGQMLEETTLSEEQHDLVATM
jgi:hypothetical protein